MGLKVTAATFVTLLALALLGELAARRAAGPRRPWELERARARAMLAFVSPCLDDVSERPAPGVERIVVIGESNASILGEALREEVRRAPCGRRYEVLNCGAPGAARQVVERRFAEALAHHPTTVLLLFGHNFRFSDTLYDPRRLRLQLWLSHSALLSRLASMLPDRGWRAPPPEPDEAPPPGDASPDAGKRAALERAVRRMASRARSAGARFVITSMASNLRMPPFVEAEALHDPRRVEAQVLWARGDTAGALAAAAAHADDAWGEFQLGAWLLSLGRADDARPHLARAVDLDHLTPRAPRAVNDALRQIARDTSSTLSDLEGTLSSLAPERVPGWETFHDCCHLRPVSSRVAVHALFASATSGGGCSLGDTPSAPEPSSLGFLRSPFELVVSGDPARDALPAQLAIVERVRAALVAQGPIADAELAAYLDGDALRAMPPPDQVRALVAIAEGCWRADRRDRALAVNERARAMPGADAWVQRGLWMLSMRRDDDARESFARAVREEPARRDLPRYVELTAPRAP